MTRKLLPLMIAPALATGCAEKTTRTDEMPAAATPVVQSAPAAEGTLDVVDAHEFLQPLAPSKEHDLYSDRSLLAHPADTTEAGVPWKVDEAMLMDGATPIQPEPPTAIDLELSMPGESLELETSPSLPPR